MDAANLAVLVLHLNNPVDVPYEPLAKTWYGSHTPSNTVMVIEPNDPLYAPLDTSRAIYPRREIDPWGFDED